MRYAFVAALLLVVVLTACAKDLCDGNDSCYLDKAIAAKDALSCVKISTDGLQASCFTDIAKAQLDTKLCANIKDPRGVAFCVGEIAILKNDSALCSAIEVSSAKDKCLFHIATDRDDASLCEGIEQDQYGDDCAYDIALKISSPDSCLVVDGSTAQRKCITFVAGDLNDSTVCGMLTREDKDWCVMNIAIKLRDKEMCADVVTSTIRSACLDGVRRSQTV